MKTTNSLHTAWSDKTVEPQPALSWAPYMITAIQASPDTPRTGFVSRAAAMRINGVECIVLCQNDHALAMVGATLTDNSFNPEMIYKATLIQSLGIEVEAVAVPVEEQVEPGPVVAEADGTPVREDGEPVAEYVADKDAEEAASAFAADEDDEL